MKNLLCSTELEAYLYVKREKPKHSIAFLRPSGNAIAAWIVLAGIGELYTPKSMKTQVGKKSILTYNFWESIFSGDINAKEKSSD